MSKTSETSDEREVRINRRDVLQATGAAAVGLGALSATASASGLNYQFFGCSQVCVNIEFEGAQHGMSAIVADGRDVECDKRPITNPSSRGNVDFDPAYCYSVSDGEAIVGLWGRVDGELHIINNPNNCANNYSCSNYPSM